MVVNASLDVLRERLNQVNLGHVPENDDDQCQKGELALAAAAYILRSPAIYPWKNVAAIVGDQRANLVRAGALIIAEIERLDRVESSKPRAVGSAA